MRFIRPKHERHQQHTADDDPRDNRPPSRPPTPPKQHSDNLPLDGKALLAAAKAGDLASVVAILDAASDADVERLVRFRGQGTPDAVIGNTAAHWAAARGHAGVLRTILERADVIDARNNGDSTVLHSAALNGHVECIHELRRRGADPEARDEFGDSAISIATRAGRAETLDALTTPLDALPAAATHAANFAADAPAPAPAADARDAGGWKAKGNVAFGAGNFDEAATCYLEALSVVDAHAAARDVATLHSNLSACRAAGSDYEGALASARESVRLAPEWAKGHSRMGAALLRLERFDEAAAAYESAAAIDPASTHVAEGAASAKRAIRQRKLEVLIERGAFDPSSATSARPKKEKTAEQLEYARTIKSWHGAAKQGNVGELERQLGLTPWVLSNRSENTAEQQLGNTALHWACAGGHEVAARWLIESAGLDVDSRNHGGSTPLHTAAAHGHAHVVALLLDLCAAPDARDEVGECAYESAARRHHRGVEAQLARGSSRLDARWKVRAEPATWSDAKSAGNVSFAKGVPLELRRSVASYTDALLLLAAAGAEGSADDEAVLRSNRSAAHAKLGHFEAALVDADAALELRPGWAKAHGRRGAALHGLGEWSRAESAYRAGLSVEPANPVLLRGLEDLPRGTAAGASGS